ncbi:MAG: prolyl-tRNA synthetase [Patescibacteria group bacterium]|nr:prolyl-tRNA synthetase [Patescibacteria group bacterium]MDE1944021.1 prolyl-tRNA synthetase [Patescibacteria group bacterium]MDE2057902.1 prolyl-tRNA synthetase [Patescibacteria group bacterium]
MRQSRLFTKARKEAPADEVAKNAQLLIRAGYVHKEMAGVYDYLPLGLKVVDKIKQIVREEMNAIGGEELIMSSLQRKELWERTSRWSDEVVDVWFKSELKAGGEVGFGWSHEEPIGEMMKNFIASYKDLPVSVYQFQTKLRNELRAKSGIMRGREFVMKDMYSFAADEASHLAYYESTKPAYMKVFKRLGIGDDTYITFAAGGAFTKFSHEFQTICDAGEDVTYIAREKGIAINEEVLNDETLANLGVRREELEQFATAEVGNIFNFGQQKAADLGLMVKDREGKDAPVWMGSYGIGVTRLVGVLVEKFADEKGLVWPEAVAPYAVHLVALGKPGDDVTKAADAFYEELAKAGVETLYDDRDMSAGAKFAESDLLGMPHRIVVGKEAAETGRFEVVTRATGAVEKFGREEIIAHFAHA